MIYGTNIKIHHQKVTLHQYDQDICVRVCFSRRQQCVSDRGISTEGVGSGEAALPESAQRVFQTGAEIRQPEGGHVPDQGDLLSSK